MKSNPFLDLAIKQVELFQQDNVAWMECLIICECTKSIMEIGYNNLVRQKVITEIEKMSLEEKNKLWELTKEFCAGRLSAHEMKRVAKGLVCLEYLLT